MTKPLLTGVLKTWKEDRGFGFITPNNGGRDVFIHISALGEVGRRPVPGDIIHYQIVRDKNGKFRAINARIEGVDVVNKTNGASTGKLGLKWILAAAVGLLILMVGAVFFYFRWRGLL
jgi:cold shock protein